MRVKVIVTGLLAALLVTGCGGARTKCNDPDSPPAMDAQLAKCAGEGAQGGGVQFEVVDEEKLPAELAPWTALNQAHLAIQGGTMVYQSLGDYLYVGVVAGEQKTGGYRVEVQQVTVTEEEERDLVHFTARLMAPPAGAATIQAITYPRAYFRVPYPATRRAPVVEGELKVEQSGATLAGPEHQTGPVTAAPPEAGAAQPAVKPEGGPKGEVRGTLEFKAIAPRELPASLQGWEQAARDEPGASVQVAGGALYISVYAGEQRTGGYRVEIRSVEMLDGTVKVQAILHRPGPGAIVTQALTYPRAFARVNYQGEAVPKIQVQWMQ